MKIAVYPGSFDPFTLGHLDILARACGLFDKVYVAVLANGEKRPCFSAEERCSMIETSIRFAGLTNAVADRNEGLLAEYVREKKACAVVRGLRDAADLAYESRLDCANRRLMPGLETVCLMARPEIKESAVSALESETAAEEFTAFEPGHE
ncbi:MAG: pantetheine-phosphate adenylyltransferase, partial [Clostridia bacterium]|nr:pantetheine-phosphate adenylyltransferase [Clostridia bacterium]